jgi:galactokinase/mevalonate kinase-like predicted kinase
LNGYSVPSTIDCLIENAETGYHILQKLFSSLSDHSENVNSEVLDELIDKLAETLNRLVINDLQFPRYFVSHICLLPLFYRYWTLKKQMATGSNPPHISKILKRLSTVSKGSELAGAGGGGFIVIILKRDCSKQDLQQSVDEINKSENEKSELCPLLTVHEVSIDNEGIINEFLFEEMNESRNAEQYLGSK